ncbi:WalW protein [Sphingomonas sp. EC-HK361]|uniref:WalW protein n=1 Tax=Sphingomonas sp. EC-HK361 TaxID=2038397 RepID=UPI001255BEA1|nr:WalW protein [Sphingomonas sp. EC-HK361]VVT07288.1 WalW protein [Sphingomonas sp. EC-HK361]
MTGAAAPSGVFRPAAPAPGARIRWPESFGSRFCLFVDAEEEFDWSRPFDRTQRATTAMAALPAFHRRLSDRGIAVTYMVDHPVATDAAAVDALKACLADGRSVIGTQLHAWVNPPFEEEPSVLASFPGNLPPSLERAKLDVLTDAITASFGVRPIAYRAGRYGLGSASAAMLATRGYRLDTSMRARHDYSTQGGPDYAGIGPESFWFGKCGDLIEVPPTTIYTGVLRRRGSGVHGVAGRIWRGRGILARTKLLSRVPLTPEGVPLREAREAVRVALGEGLRLLNFGFHTPSLVPGWTPYVRDTADLRRFNAWWDGVLDLLAQLGCEPASLDDILAAAR